VTCYAIANVKAVQFCPDIAEYLGRIDETLDRHGGRFLVHGGPVTHMEGNWTGQLILIEFPDRSELADPRTPLIDLREPRAERGESGGSR
jgi:uncharacterized protein (DUF1330 family)